MRTIAHCIHPRPLLSALVATAALFAAAPVAPALATTAAAGTAMTSLPQEMRYDGISYRTGGTGAGEARALKEAMHKYALSVELLEKQRGSQHDAYTADAQVRISDHGGKEVFTARAAGPFMLVQLAPGEYSIAATLNGHTLHKRDVRIEKGKAMRETFVFPAGTG